MKLNLVIPDFERYVSDQQFVNVVDALERMEHRKGGLFVEEVWEMAWQVVEMLRKAQRPEITAKRLLTLIITKWLPQKHICLRSHNKYRGYRLLTPLQLEKHSHHKDHHCIHKIDLVPLRSL